jgi:hypothetical protein
MQVVEVWKESAGTPHHEASSAAVGLTRSITYHGLLEVGMVNATREGKVVSASCRTIGFTIGFTAVIAVATCIVPLASSAQPTAAPPARITLGAPQQIFGFREPNSFGLFNVPDMHTAVLQQPDKSYLVWITGNVGPAEGAIARLSTTDFVHYANAGPGTPARAEPVLVPSCRGLATRAPRNPRNQANSPRGAAAAAAAPAASCQQNPDADYVGANAVIPARDGSDLLMFYEAGNKSIGDMKIEHGWEFNVIARARSTDNGLTWTRQDVVLSGADPKPVRRTEITQPGISEPGAIVANGYIYMFYQYVPNEAAGPDAPSAIQVARAPLVGDGAAGTWMKYERGSFSQQGLGGRGSPIVATGGASGCTRPVEVWPARSSYLDAYVLFYLCNEGWFFSTSTDLVSWTPPAVFMPMKMWQPCRPMDWNYTMVTPGSPGGIIGERGYVLYAHTDARGLGCAGRFAPHMLWVRPFAFEKSR